MSWIPRAFCGEPKSVFEITSKKVQGVKENNPYYIEMKEDFYA